MGVSPHFMPLRSSTDELIMIVAAPVATIGVIYTPLINSYERVSQLCRVKTEPCELPADISTHIDEHAAKLSHSQKKIKEKK